jgi:hypothetical protein
MTPAIKTFLKWLTFGIVLPFAVFIIVGLIIVANHKDTPQQLRNKYINDSIQRHTDGVIQH